VVKTIRAITRKAAYRRTVSRPWYEKCSPNRRGAQHRRSQVSEEDAGGDQQQTDDEDGPQSPELRGGEHVRPVRRVHAGDHGARSRDEDCGRAAGVRSTSLRDARRISR
jgi:hypothetical protein